MLLGWEKVTYKICRHSKKILQPLNEASIFTSHPNIPKRPSCAERGKDTVGKDIMFALWTVDCDHWISDNILSYRDKYNDEFRYVVFLLCRFHQAHTYIMVICKITRDRGAEDILVAVSLCQEITPNNMFWVKADYYQTIHASRILSESKKFHKDYCESSDWKQAQLNWIKI